METVITLCERKKYFRFSIHSSRMNDFNDFYIVFSQLRRMFSRLTQVMRIQYLRVIGDSFGKGTRKERKPQPGASGQAWSLHISFICSYAGEENPRWRVALRMSYNRRHILRFTTTAVFLDSRGWRVFHFIYAVGSSFLSVFQFPRLRRKGTTAQAHLQVHLFFFCFFPVYSRQEIKAAGGRYLRATTTGDQYNVYTYKITL